MAARRAAAASPAGLKIKVKAGVKASSKEGPPQESGEAAEPADHGVVTNSNARMLKRKRLTPPGSPAVSKRPPRGESPHTTTANGEPAEPVPKKLASNITDLNAINNKQDVTKPDELLEPGTERKLDSGIKAYSNLQGDLQVSSGAAAAGVASAAPKADVNASGDQSVAPGVQVSSSLATSIVPTQAEDEKHHTVPSHAGWYSWTEIHTLEKRGLPEFFSGKVPGNSQEMYMEHRNTIMKKYREHLGTVITAADMQEHLSGVDEKSIYRIMEFLDHWGLINYHASAEFLPSWKHCSPVVESDAALMLQALPRKGSSLYHFDSAGAPVLQQIPMKPKTMDSVIAEMLAFGEGAEVDYHCNSCAADCSKQRYHCQKQADFDLCSDCYNEGLFGPDMVSADFIKMDVTEASNANGGGWTDQETLLLLEALELYGDNWNEIAEHVATKSKSQCILHFVRLPVEDPFSDNADKPASNSNAAPATTPQTDSSLEVDEQEDKEVAAIQEDQEIAAKQEDKEAAGKGPEDDTANVTSTDNSVESRSEELLMPQNLAAFAEAGNPVMAQMAFLATMIGSKLGGEAALAALAALSTKDPGVHLAAGTAMILEGPTADGEPSALEHPDRSGQADEETQSGDETAAAVDAGPSPATGDKLPVHDSTAPVQTEDGAPTQQEPRQESSLGKEILQKSDVSESLNALEEAKVAGRVKRAAASAVAAASVKAKLLADQEEREIQRLLAVVIDHQVKKLELKLKFLNELEDAVGKECETVDRDRLNFFADHARIAAQHLGGPSNSNPPPSPPRQQQQLQQQRQQQQQQALVLAQAPAPFQGQMYGHGFQAGVGAPNHHLPNHAAFVQQQMYQGLANSMNAGAMTMQQGHFQRQIMMAGNAGPHMLGRPQELVPPPQIMMGRPMMSSDAPPGMPGLARPVPGGALGGMPQ